MSAVFVTRYVKECCVPMFEQCFCQLCASCLEIRQMLAEEFGRIIVDTVGDDCKEYAQSAPGAETPPCQLPQFPPTHLTQTLPLPVVVMGQA